MHSVALREWRQPLHNESGSGAYHGEHNEVNERHIGFNHLSTLEVPCSGDPNIERHSVEKTLVVSVRC